MSKKLHSKLLSVILVIAICCATLCGSLIAANAAIEGYSGSYTINVGDEKHAVPYAATVVKATVEFNLAAGFAGGEFTIVAEDGEYTIGETVTAVAGTRKDGSDFNTSDVEVTTFANGKDRDVVFFINDGTTLYTYIKFEYTINMVEYVKYGGNTRYPVSILVDGNNFGTANEVDTTFTVSQDSDTFFHAHSAWNASADVENTKDGYHYVGTAICPSCEYVNSSDGYRKYVQVYPDYTEFDGATGLTSTSATGWLGISGVTVDYADDGTLSINTHVYSLYRPDSVILIICDENGKEIYRTGTVANGTSHLKDRLLYKDTKMFTISNISARDISKKLLITAIENSTSSIEYSRTVEFSLADYCLKVVNDEAIWTDDATAERIEGDKDVAAALYYYGASIEESVFDKGESGSGSVATTVTPVEKTTAVLDVNNCNYYGTYQPDPNSSGYNPAVITWDNFLTSLDATENANATGEKATPYIVTTAEQVMYLTGIATANDTQGKYFKVSDKIGAFNFMNNASFTPATTAADVKAWTESSANGWKYKHSVQLGAFAGTFDGNGAVFYNLSKDGNYAGLFPLINMNTTIKNVTVAASVFNTNSDYAKGSGGIFGSVNGDWNGSTITIENCNVVNCYITSQAGTYGAGAIGGYSHALVVTIDGCFIADNIITTTVNAPVGGVIATSYNSNSVLKNTVVLGTTPYNTWPANHTNSEGCNFENPAHQTYNNVYTDQAKNTCYKDKENTTLREFSDAEIKVISPSDAKGANAVSNLKLDSSLYVATSGFPVLKSNYTWTPIYDNEETHTYKAAVSLDGVVTNYTANTEAHTMVEDTENKVAKCECGYTVEISNIPTTVTPVEKTTAVLDVNNCNYYGTYQPDPNSSGYNPAVITWDNFLTSLDATENANATGEKATPYIVTTAEQVMYLTGIATANDTQGKYFKVSDKIGAFNFMNNASFTPATTAADVKAWTESSANGWKYKHSVQLGAFAGTFDGNGAVFYNLSKDGNYAGLFPLINMNTTIKNVTVAASVFNTNSDYAKGSGGIFGSVNGDWNGSTITIENCNVVNCYITSQAGTYGAGAIGGYSHALVVTIDGCFIADNIITTTVNAPVGGVIATSYNSNSVLKNTVVLGTTPYNTWPANHTNSEGCNFENPAHQTYNNVYTDQAKNTCYKDKENTTLREFSDAEIKVISPSDAKGANAVSNLKLDSSLYVATSGFPVLKSNYTWTPIYDNEETHTYKAAVSLDGVVTNYTANTEAHTMVEDTENKVANCACGYSYEIKGIYSLDLPESVLNQIKRNSIFAEKFASNAAFTNAYGADNYHDITDENCWLYATSLNLKVNPHIAFTFVFKDEYKTNRGNISLTFTTADGSVYKTDAVETDGVLGTNWVNNSGAGRYHLYRFKELPVTKLCQRINVTLNYGNETRDFGSYSAAGYAINAMNAGADYVNHVNAAMAFVYYSEMLAERYGA